MMNHRFAGFKQSLRSLVSRSRRPKRRSHQSNGVEALEARTLLSGNSLILQNAVDTHLIQGTVPQANVGGYQNLEFYATYVTYGGPVHRPLLQFDLSPTAGAVPQSATLELYQLDVNNYAGSDMTVEVYAVSRDWEEGNGLNPWASSDGASWETADTNDPWTQNGGDFNTTFDFGNGTNGLIDTQTLTQATDGSWVSFDVTAAVAAWNSGQLENHGFAMVITSGDYTYYSIASSQYSDSSLAPKLTFEQAAGPEVTVSTPDIVVDESVGTAVVTVTLAEVPEATVTVDYTTVDDTANAGSDYSAVSGTLTFPAGTTDLTRDIVIPILNDDTFEDAETFEFRLSHPVNAIVGNVAATVTIENDDPRGSEPIVLQNAIDNHLISFANPYSNMGGSTQLDFYATYVTYGGPAYRPLLEFDLTSVADVVPGSATLELYQLEAANYAGSDMTVEVYALNQAWEEGTGIDPWAPGNGSSWQNAGTNDPWLQTGSDFNTSFDFGHGPNGLVATGTLSQATEGDWVGFDVAGAVAAWNSGQLPNHGFVMIITSGDYTMYPVASSEYSDATLAPRLTIEPGEQPPELPEISVSTTEITIDEHGGNALVYVTLSESPEVDVSVLYTTFNETAMAVSDYMGQSDLLTFAASTTDLTRHISVPIVNDNLHEETETFGVRLNGAVNAVLGTDTSTITILDNDEVFVPPTLLISDTHLTEGDAGTKTVTATVTLQNPPSNTVQVDYVTADYTAVAGIDYVATSGQLTFPSGTTVRHISVTINGDTQYETDEKFRIQLSDAVNADVGDGSGFITITNDDDAPANELPFFNPNDLMSGYLGGFELPSGGNNGEFTFGGGYAGLGLALRPNAAGTANSLYVTGGNTYQINGTAGTYEVSANAIVAEVSIPSELNMSPAQMLTSSLLDSVDLTGMLETTSRGESGDVIFEGNGANYEIQIDDLLVVDGRLAVSAYVGYDVGLGATHSHFFIDKLNLSNVTDQDVIGLFDITQGLTGQGFDGTDAGYVAGYMTDVPAEWQAALGGPHLLGQASINGVLRTSAGPSAFAFDASAIGTAGFQTPETLAYYPLQANQYLGETPQPLAFTLPSFDSDPAIIDDPLFNWNATVEDVTFAPGTRSVLFFGSIGIDDDTGESFVGYGDSPVYNDYARGHYKGPHSLNGGYEYQVWAYDVNDYVKVRNGELAPWDVQPHDVWTFDFPGLVDQDPGKRLGGTAFDPVTNRLYVAQQRIGDTVNGIPGQSPIIHVFQLGSGTTASGSGGQASVLAAAETSSGSQSLWAARSDADPAVSQFQTTTILQATLGPATTVDADTSTETSSIDDSRDLDDIALLATTASNNSGETDNLSTLLDEISVLGFLAG